MENSAEKLYNILGTKFDNTDIKTLTSTGKETTEMEEIKMFSFDFMMDSKDYGPVVILISAEDNLEVYYGDNTSRSLDRHAKKKWENLIEHLSTFARTNRFGFSLKHTTDLKYDLSNIADITESYKNIFESYYGTSKTSYNPQGKAKIIIKHSRKLGEGEKRFRNISRLFIENSEGERFKLPFKKLTGARAMARHVTEGGNPYDLFGVHICEMVKDINTLGGFVRRSKMFEDDEATSGLVETGRTHYTSLRKGLKQIAGKRGYHTFKESWKPEEITALDEDTDTIRKLFTERSINSKVEDALPLLKRLQQMAEASEDQSPEDDTGDHFRKDHLKFAKEVKSKQFPGDTHPDQDDWGTDEDDEENDPHPYNMPEGEIEEVTEFEQWADGIVEQSHRVTPNTSGKPTEEETYNKIKDYSSTALRGYGRKVGVPDEVINPIRNRSDRLLDEIMGHLYGDDWERTLMDKGTFNEETTNEESLSEGTWAVPETPKQLRLLIKWLSTEQPLGVDAANVTDSLYHIIGDDDLFDTLSKKAERNSSRDARPFVIKWIKNAIRNLEFKNPAALTNLQKAITAVSEGVSEGMDKDLDADNEEQLNASINKDVDNHIKKDNVEEDQTGANMNKLFTEYVAEVEEAKEEVIDEETEVEEDVEVVEEDTVELEEAHDGPVVTMDNGDDLGALMQRTNHLLKK